MSGPLAATSALNAPPCGLPSPAPGARSPLCAVHATLPAAAACAAACLAAPECTAYTWHANASHLAPWALACVFRLDGAWDPTAPAPDHAAGQKVAPPPWPIADGFERLPTMWFGANASGLDSAASLAAVARHRVAAFGWQQGTGGAGMQLGAGDAYQAAATTHLSDYLDAQPAQAGANRTLVATYRQVMIAQRLFAPQRAAADAAQDGGFWLQNGAGSACAFGMPWGTQDPVWNFSVAAAADYWVAAVAGALASGAAATGARAVFFDDSDYQFCGFWDTPQGGCGALPLASLARMHADNNAVLARTAAALNAAGLIPIFSSVNLLAAGGGGGGSPCALPEEATLAALAGTTFARFYEFFPQTTAGVRPEAVLANAVLEAQAGVPVIAHFYTASCPAAPRVIARPGRLGGALEFQLAAFLVLQAANSVFSVSGGWYDADFCWHAEFDVAYGAPLGPAVRTGQATWARNLTRATVAVDVAAGTGEVMLLP